MQCEACFLALREPLARVSLHDVDWKRESLARVVILGAEPWRGSATQLAPRPLRLARTVIALALPRFFRGSSPIATQRRETHRS